MILVIFSRLFLLILLLKPNISSAQKIAISGENISTDKMNASILQIGSIQQALLTQSEFQSLNGDCWVMMAGQDISGSDYASFTGRSSLPDASGKFLRNTGGNAEPLAQIQSDDFKSHTHIQNAHSHGLTMYQDSGGGGSPNNPVHGSASINSQVKTTSSVAAINQNTGGIETRPVNVSVNFFIKINKQCNFN